MPLTLDQITKLQEAEREANRSVFSRFTEAFSEIITRKKDVFKELAGQYPTSTVAQFPYAFRESLFPTPTTPKEKLESLALGVAGPLGGERKILQSGLTKASQAKFLSKFSERAQKPLETVLKSSKTEPLPGISADIFQQRRGILNDAAIKELSKGKIGVLDKLLEAPPGTILPAEEALASRQQLADSVLKALKVSEKAASEIGEKALPKVLGVRAETGRALRSYSQPLEGAQELLKAAEKTLDQRVAKNLRELARIIGGAQRNPGLMDKLVEWATAIKLTSPLTQARNIGGNTFAMLLKTPERFFTGASDAVRSVITGRARERFASEAIADVAGTFHGFKEGSRKAVQALLDETVSMGQRRVEEAVPYVGGAIEGKLGKAVRLPFRVLTAEDLFFRTANNAGAMHALATRKALQEGLAGSKMSERVAKLLEAPTDDMIKYAEQEAKRFIFQEDLTGFMKSVDLFRQKHPFIRLFVPFFKTPTNIFKSIIQRTPLTFALPSSLKALKAGGGEASEVFGRMLTGSAVMSTFIVYALEGNITGKGPTNKAERDALYRAGWQPYAIKIGNRYFSYRGFEPLSGYLSLAADVAETGKEPSEQQVLSTLAAITRDFIDQPFLTGVADVLDAMRDPEKYGGKFFANFLAGSTIPTGVSYWARLQDPVYRQPKSFLQTFESRLPFLSERVTPLRNVFGEEQIREGGLAQRMLPTVMSEAQEDALDQELSRLGKVVGFPSRTAFGQKLTDDEYDTLLRVSGQIARDALYELVQSAAYQNMNDNKREKAIDVIVDKVREEVRKRAFVEKDLLRQIENNLKKRGLSTERAEMMAPEILQKMLSAQAAP